MKGLWTVEGIRTVEGMLACGPFVDGDFRSYGRSNDHFVDYSNHYSKRYVLSGSPSVIHKYISNWAPYLLLTFILDFEINNFDRF